MARPAGAPPDGDADPAPTPPGPVAPPARDDRGDRTEPDPPAAPTAPTTSAPHTVPASEATPSRQHLPPPSFGDGRRALRWALAALFVAATLLSFGAFLNDEVLQATALHNLLQGDLFLEEEPDHLWHITDEARFRFRESSTVGGHVVPGGSGLLNLLALPVGWALLLVDRLVPLRIPLLAAWGVLGYHASRWGVDAARGLWGRGAIDWHRPLGPLPARWIAWGWAWTALAAWGAASMPHLDLRNWVTFIALQLTNLLLLAATAGLLWWVVARAVPGGRRLAGLAVVLLLLSPALFWGVGAKYHAAQAFLAVAAAALYHGGVRGRREALVFAAVAVAGLAVWSNQMGIAMVAAVGLVHAGSLLRGGPWSWRDWRHVLGFGGSAVAGMVPWAVYATATFSAPWTSVPAGGAGGGAGAGGGGAGGGGAGGGAGETAGRVAGQWQFQDLEALARNVWDAHIDAARFEGEPAAVWLIAPWAVVSVLALLRLRKPPAVRVLAVHLLLTLLVVGPRLPTQGSGLDPRFLAGLWPAYVLLLAWGLHDLDWRRPARRALALWAAAGSTAVLAALWALAAAGVVFVAADGSQLARAQPWVGRGGLLLVLLGSALYAHRPSRRWLPALLGLSLAPGVLWMVNGLLVHHRRLPGIDGAPDAAFLTPVALWLWDWAWDRLVPCAGRYLCEVR